MPAASTTATLASFDPARPGDLVAEVAPMSAAEIEAAVVRCRIAQPDWARSGPARADALDALANELEARRDMLSELIAREVGKPIAEARAEVVRAQAITRYYAQVALDADGVRLPSADRSTSLTARRVPLGTALLVCPWNFPLAIPIWKAAPALAHGNTALLKPAGAAIGVASALGECAAACLPPGVLEVLFVRGRDLGGLLDDSRIDGVSFTGSTDVGRTLVARVTGRGAPAQAEMGGHNAAIVLDDASLEHAADAIVGGATGFAGQRCTATRRVVAVGAVHDRLLELLRARWGKLSVGDPLETEATVGPLIDATAAAEFNAAVRGALAPGGELVARADAPGGEGHYVEPALVSLDDPGARANQEETFGPLLTVLRAHDAEDALALANGTRYGLVGAVHGRDVGRATALAERLDCGMQRVNASTTGVDFHAPFGGAGASSFGPREQGRAAAEFYTEWRTLTVTAVPE